ncbi:HvfC/BufC family peptide modification chaperone [Nitrincola sp. A-D6]|uniref:HvfC/BufC family peptide modification chaperone n=1 Tax=Nitrincola sp. A-D6 TaxID=1545442 RepID=UPI00069075C7|nr:putative DNA-binding domain-containing protein [Nitrincola sp. A-D6]
MSNLAPNSLAELQTRLQDYVLGDGVIDAGSNTDGVLSVLAGGDSDRGKQRLNIYHNAYRSRLLEVLQSAFERSWIYLGDEAFNSICTRYIDTHASHSANLRNYGGDFPHFLRQAFPSDPEVAELATMDWRLHSAFDAANADLLTNEQLAVVDETQWESLGFVFHPSVSLELFEWNTLDIWHALNQGESPPVVQRLGVPLGHLFWRNEQRGYFRSLDEAEYAALKGLIEGHSFAGVCEELALNYRNNGIENSIGSWLARWLADELLSAIELNPVSFDHPCRASLADSSL